LSPAAKKILEDRGSAWEGRLFFQVWLDTLANSRVVVDARDGSLGAVPDAALAISWIISRLSGLEDAIARINQIIANEFPEVCGSGTSTGEPLAIIKLARKLALCVNALRFLEADCRTTQMPPPFHQVPAAFATALAVIVSRASEFPRRALEHIAAVVRKHPHGGRINLRLKLDVAPKYLIKAIYLANLEYRRSGQRRPVLSRWLVHFRTLKGLLREIEKLGAGM